MIDYAAELEWAYVNYSDAVFEEAKRARAEIDYTLKKHGLTICCGMGTWVLSDTKGKTVYVEDMENPPKELLDVVDVLDICMEGMRDHCFGSIM